MPETTTTESTSEMRLIDHAVFKEIVERYDQGTDEASNRVGRLRDALRHLKVDPVSLESQDQLDDLRHGICAVIVVDEHNEGQRWCEQGFRHKLPGAQYSWGSTVAISAQIHGFDLDDPVNDTNDAWNVESSLNGLMMQLEEVATLLDQLSHSSDASENHSSDWPYPHFLWSVDILTTVVLEASMKSLWVLRNPGRNPKSQLGHRFSNIWAELQSDHATIVDHIAGLPIWFRCLKPREIIKAQVTCTFDTIPDDEWNQAHYWFTSNTTETRRSLPHHKFAIALATFCVAMKVALGQL